MRGSGEWCEFSLSEYQDGQDTKFPKVRMQHINIMFRSNKYGTKHPNWRLGWAEGLTDLFTTAPVRHHYWQFLAANELTSGSWQLFYQPHVFVMGGSGDVLSILIDVSVKSNRRRRNRIPCCLYLYLLGILLTDAQSNLELGLFIHLHGRRWLGSSREFIVLLCLFL